MRMGYFAQIAGTPETNKQYDTVVAWRDASEVLTVTGATTAKVEAANTGIKNVNRTGRGFCNSTNYNAYPSPQPSPELGSEHRSKSGPAVHHESRRAGNAALDAVALKVVQNTFALGTGVPGSSICDGLVPQELAKDP